MKTKPPFDGEIHAVSAKTMPDLSSPKREPGWFLGEPTPTRDEAVQPIGRQERQAFELWAFAEWHNSNPPENAWKGWMARAQFAAKLASAPAPASGGVEAVAWTRGLEEAFRLAFEGYSKPADHFHDTHTWGCFILKRVSAIFTILQKMKREAGWPDLASLSPAATPVSEAGGEVEQLKAYRDELLKIAADVGEPDDPFAAWEAIAALKARALAAEAALAGERERAITAYASHIDVALREYDDNLSYGDDALGPEMFIERGMERAAGEIRTQIAAPGAAMEAQ